jgi:hypothetical protein
VILVLELKITIFTGNIQFSDVDCILIKQKNSLNLEIGLNQSCFIAIYLLGCHPWASCASLQFTPLQSNGLKSSSHYSSSSPKPVEHWLFAKLSLWHLATHLSFCHQHSSFWVLAEYLRAHIIFLRTHVFLVIFLVLMNLIISWFLISLIHMAKLSTLTEINFVSQSFDFSVFWSFIIPTLGHPYQVFSTHLFPFGFVSLQPKRC